VVDGACDDICRRRAPPDLVSAVASLVLVGIPPQLPAPSPPTVRV